MANHSELTRKDQVLRYLQRNDRWVDGPELANEQVGGSEGLKRVRELRAEGHRIITRPHPDRKRDIFQYKLIKPESIAPVVQERLDWVAQTVSAHEPEEPSDPLPPEPQKRLTPAGRQFLMRKTEDGMFELTKEVCVDCGGMYDDDLEHRTTDKTHLRWVQAQQEATGQEAIGLPEQPPPYKFTSMPTKIDMGTMAWCPRCKGHRKQGRRYFNRKKGAIIETVSEEFTRDPFKPTVKGEPNPCQRCGGFGVIPVHVQEGSVAL